jgi:cell volume regulation protein A
MFTADHVDGRQSRPVGVGDLASIGRPARTFAVCKLVAARAINILGVHARSKVADKTVREYPYQTIGVAFGLLITAVLIPILPALRDNRHSYTVFLASMLILYALTQLANGNGALAVLTAALLIGNASTLVPKIIPGAHPEAFVFTETARVMQDQMSFLIKSFFFTLIGLMFPTSPRLIALGALGAVVLLLFRIPAVKLSTMNLGFTKKQTWLTIVAIPRGLAAGVLSTLPLQYGIAGAESFSPGVFALIVTSIVLFTVGFAVVSRMSNDSGNVARATGS